MSNYRKLIILEFGCHYHVIPPIISLFEYSNSIIFIDAKCHNFMNKTLQLYKLNSEIKDIRNSRSFILELLKAGHDPIIVVSTAREYLLSKQEFLQLFLIALFRPKILCIRNPVRWTYKGLRLISPKSAVYKTVFTLLVLKFLIRRARNLIVESEAQKKFMFDNFPLPKNKNVIPFPGRLFDVTPIKKDIVEIELNAQLVIGILGSIDDDKRNYVPIFTALKTLLPQHSIIVVFLGNTQAPSSAKILSLFNDLVKTVWPTEQSWWDEQTFYSLGLRCSFLISPFKKSWDYGGSNGSGALADAIFLKKFILVPDFVFFGSEYDDFIIKYSEVDLAVAIKKYLKSPGYFGNTINKHSSKWLKSQLT